MQLNDMIREAQVGTVIYSVRNSESEVYFAIPEEIPGGILDKDSMDALRADFERGERESAFYTHCVTVGDIEEIKLRIEELEESDALIGFKGEEIFTILQAINTVSYKARVNLILTAGAFEDKEGEALDMKLARCVKYYMSER